MKKLGVVLLIAVVMTMVFSVTASAQAITTGYSISRLAPNGGVLWSSGRLWKSDKLKGTLIFPDASTGHMTVRVYKADDHQTHVADYMNVYSSTTQRQTPFYNDYREDRFTCQMKFSNDTATAIASSGDWGLTTSTAVINN